MTMRVRRRGPTLAMSATVEAAPASATIAPSRQTSPRPTPGRWHHNWEPLRTDIGAALPGWAAARLIVLAALALAHFLVDHLHVADPAVKTQVHQGLFAWDAGFYRGIATHGYGFGAVPHEALRFFPLFPLAGRELGALVGGHADWVLLALANGSALLVGSLLHRLVLIEKGDAALARRAAWLVALVPPAFVLVLGYSEATFMALAVGMFLALRTQHWVTAALLGALAALTRPVGLLLAVPAAVEATRCLVLAGRQGALSWRARRRRDTLRAVAPPVSAALAPLLGAGTFCVWAWVRYGDLLLPMRIQQDARLRGTLVDPLTAILHESRGILHGQHVGSGLHVPWAIALALLVVVCFRRWPAAYGAFAAVMLLAALSSRNLDSLERYVLSAFPFVLAGASLTASGRTERLTLSLGAAALGGYALLAFLNAVVP
jgi:hypothetical protein